MEIDPAVLRALSLDAAQTSCQPHGGSGFTSTAKISTTLSDGSEKHFFMKTGRGKATGVMFRGEHASLNAIHDSVPSLCPASFAEGTLDHHGSGAFLVTDFLDMSGSRVGSEEEGSGLSLAAKLAKLHTTPAPVPKGYSEAMFGFVVPTCCGDTEQPNDYDGSWADFYAKNRLLAVLRKSERTNGKDAGLRALVEKTATETVARLIGDGHLNNGHGVTPVVVHGDLWSGNKGRGRIGGQGAVEDVVFDPSACHAHSEYELGIMQMFGGFGGTFLKEYHKICPKTEPVGEYEDRIKLYELYHHLNHHAIFGGGYKSGAHADLKSWKTTPGPGSPSLAKPEIVSTSDVGRWKSFEDHMRPIDSEEYEALLNFSEDRVKVEWLGHCNIEDKITETSSPIVQISRYYTKSGHNEGILTNIGFSGGYPGRVSGAASTIIASTMSFLVVSDIGHAHYRRVGKEMGGRKRAVLIYGRHNVATH